MSNLSVLLHCDVVSLSLSLLFKWLCDYFSLFFKVFLLKYIYINKYARTHTQCVTVICAVAYG